jgi:hypothetical protein
MWIQGEVNLHQKKEAIYVGGNQNGAWTNHMEQISQDSLWSKNWEEL